MNTFGVDFHEHLKATKRHIPIIVTKCINEIDERGKERKRERESEEEEREGRREREEWEQNHDRGGKIVYLQTSLWAYVHVHV